MNSGKSSNGSSANMNMQNRLLYAQQLRAQQQQQQQQIIKQSQRPSNQQIPQQQQQQRQQQQQQQVQVPGGQVPKHQARQYQTNTVQMAPNTFYTMSLFKNRREAQRLSIIDKYDVLGYIAAGTYGKVYKAKGKANAQSLFAIKKFKSDSRDNEVMYHTGISQSAVREMSLCNEIIHKNISTLTEIILEKKCIFMIFEFAEYDLLQIIHHHSHPEIKPITKLMLKSTIFQVLQGLSYLHQNWVMHRDLKPANIMVTKEGIVKVGDLGLARKFNNQLQSLYSGDKVVVTIWYRAPELLLGAKHYTPAVDLWAVGCILAEMISLRPVFKGEEAKMDNKKHMPFQENQLLKILEILGTPSLETWPTLSNYPEFSHMSKFTLFPSNLKAWYDSNGGNDQLCFDLLKKLLFYDPITRINALDSMKHEWFNSNDPKPISNIFLDTQVKYPRRKIHKDDVDILGGVNPANAVSGANAYNNNNSNNAIPINNSNQQYNMAVQKRNYELMNTTANLRNIYDTKRKK